MLDVVSSINNNEYKVDKEEFFYYFTPSFYVEKDERRINLYCILSIGDKTIVKYKLDSFKNEECSCAICNKYNKKCEHVEALVKNIYENNKDEITNQIANYQDEIKEEIRKENQKNFEIGLKTIKKEIDADDVIELQEKVHIEPNITGHYVSFKVGRTRLYTISNISDFVYRFSRQEEHSYGKELKFIHNYAILDEPSQKLLSYIEQTKIYIYQRKELELKDNFFDHIMSYYKGYYINYNDEPYFVRLDNIPTKIKINNQYQLSVQGIKNCYFILDSYAYGLNKQEHIIDFINEDERYCDFVYNIINYPEASIYSFLEDFKYSIYLKFQEHFIIDDAILDKFIFEDITIQAFFDFDDKKIKLNTKVLKNEKEINPNKLDKVASKQYHKYNILIQGLKFIDNEISDEQDILNFLSSDLAPLKAIAEVYLSDSLKNKKIVTFTKPSVRIAHENDLMSIFMEDSDYDKDELLEILKALKKKRKYVLLKDDKIVTLDNQDANTFYNIVEDFNLNEKNLLEEQRVPLYQVFKAYQYEKSVSMDSFLSTMLATISTFKDSLFDLPNLNATLRPYQKEAFLWLKTLCSYQLGGILADDMGLGKTLEMISLISSLNEEAPSLIVCPKSLIFNWLSEFKKFAPKEKVIPIYGGTNQRTKLIDNINKNKKVTYITSYDTLRMDSEAYSDKNFNCVILDEGQFIKNVDALKTKSVKKLQAKYRFVLTGTPIENSIIDLWSIFDFLMPGYLLPLSEFKSLYEGDENYANVVVKKVAPFILRRTKKDVLKDLPSKYDVVITCEMKEEQRKLYDAQRLQASEILGMGGRVFDVLYVLTRLRQICVDPSMFIENYFGGSGKMDELLNIIDSRIQDGHRILIFSQFVKSLEIIKEKLIKKKINFAMITGDTKAIDRVAICNEFNQTLEKKIVLISLKAGGTGLNLTGADCVIHVDPWWNVAAQDQATDRAHRIGQTKNVEVIRLICENSIEQRVIELQNMKKELIEKMISDDDSSITSLSKEDLQFILN